MEKNIEIISSGGIQCDNENCNWTDATLPVSEMKEWIDRPCPNCGSNLLTQEDYNGMIIFLAATDIINDIDLSHLKEPGKQPTLHTVNFHKGIIIEDSKNG